MRVVSEVHELVRSEYRTGEKIFLAGEAAYISLDGESPVFGDMEMLSARPANFRLVGEATRLHVGVPQEILSEVKAQPKIKFYLMLDVYLHYMRRLKDDFLFIGGAEGDSETNLEFFMVKQGRVVSVFDKRLPAMRAYDFGTQFRLALNDVLEHSNYQLDHNLPVYWAYPLDLTDAVKDVYDVIEVNDTHLNIGKLRLRNVVPASKEENKLRTLTIPLIGLVAGAALGAAPIAYQWMKYQTLQRNYVAEVADVADVYQRGTAMLDTLSRQQQMLDKTPNQKDLIAHWTTLASAALKSGAVVKRIAVYDEGAKGTGLAGRATDFEMDLTIKGTGTLPDRLYGKQLLTELAQASGYGMWLRAGEVKTTGDVRTIEIEGVWNVQ
ncbi:hypothetical protein MHL40_16615 [Pseudomonas luteola]|uniref:hypothetical protein n=1 Tax=Pseudomonas luteola TaxID=47886 RepID=UPI001EF6762B|nr:hypothetical protein [Pseudomonas luteola]MCG7374277.1 hypothetical protein [Pseudomonas luteola]